MLQGHPTRDSTNVIISPQRSLIRNFPASIIRMRVSTIQTNPTRANPSILNTMISTIIRARLLRSPATLLQQPHSASRPNTRSLNSLADSKASSAHHPKRRGHLTQLKLTSILGASMHNRANSTRRTRHLFMHSAIQGNRPTNLRDINLPPKRSRSSATRQRSIVTKLRSLTNANTTSRIALRSLQRMNIMQRPTPSNQISQRMLSNRRRLAILRK